MDDFPDAVALVYSSTPARDQGLREVVSAIACENIDQLLAKQKFQDILQETTGFAFDLVKGLAGTDRKKEMSYKCPKCKKTWTHTALSGDTCYYCIYCGYGYSEWPSRVV